MTNQTALGLFSSFASFEGELYITSSSYDRHVSFYRRVAILYAFAEAKHWIL